MESGLGFWCHIECQCPIGSRSFCEIIGTTLIRIIEWNDTGTRIAYQPREEARHGTSRPPTEGVILKARMERQTSETVTTPLCPTRQMLVYEAVNNVNTAKICELPVILT